MGDEVPNKELKRRTNLLRKLDITKRRLFSLQNLDNIVHVLIENRDNDGYLRGYSENYLPVYVKGEEVLRNKIVKVRLLGLKDKLVYGEIVD